MPDLDRGRHCMALPISTMPVCPLCGPQRVASLSELTRAQLAKDIKQQRNLQVDYSKVPRQNSKPTSCNKLTS